MERGEIQKGAQGILLGNQSSVKTGTDINPSIEGSDFLF